MKPQIISVRGEEFFICDYTGAPITKRFYIPYGKHQKAKAGCYATLPILLRHELDMRDGIRGESWVDLKEQLQLFYNQPDIPVQPALPLDRTPLSRKGLEKYLMEMNMGTAWLDVEKGESIEDLPRKKIKIQE